jgi:heme-degrading monooxygenase HmoA
MRLEKLVWLIFVAAASLCAVMVVAVWLNAASAVSAKQNVKGAQVKKVVARIWHGRTPTAKADEYYGYLKEAGITKIESIEGNLGAQVLRRTEGQVTEFTVISYWESLDAIRKYAGDDIEKTHNLPKDPQYLLELEPRVKHFEVMLDDRK